MMKRRNMRAVRDAIENANATRVKTTSTNER